jgi:hypothetical protein
MSYLYYDNGCAGHSAGYYVSSSPSEQEAGVKDFHKCAYRSAHFVEFQKQVVLTGDLQHGSWDIMSGEMKARNLATGEEVVIPASFKNRTKSGYFKDWLDCQSSF